MKTSFNEFLNEKKEFDDVDFKNANLISFIQEVELKTEYIGDFRFIILPEQTYKLYSYRRNEYEGWKLLSGIFKNSKTKELINQTVSLSPYELRLLKKYITDDSYNKLLFNRTVNKYNL